MPPPKRPTTPKPRPKVGKLTSPTNHRAGRPEPKTFSIAPWSGAGEGQKIVIYGPSGIGKTTLAATAPNPIFIGIDDGGRKIKHPDTGEDLNNIPGIETFQDVRDALGQPDLFPKGSTVIVDTLTKLCPWIEAHVVANVKVKGSRVASFRHFGWDGDRYVLDQGRLLMEDLDRLARQGLRVALLCQQGQIKVPNASGADYLQDGPFLPHRQDCSFYEETKQWADHVLRLGYLDLEVEVAKGAKTGKVVSEDTTRAVFTRGAAHFTAKSRPEHGCNLPEIISFAGPGDSSLWAYLTGDIEPEDQE